jgi:hypothetical protein
VAPTKESDASTTAAGRLQQDADEPGQFGDIRVVTAA